MRHARPDYDERIQDSAGLIPDDEPVLLIRGQDQAAVATGEAWVRAHLMNGGDVAVAIQVEEQVYRIKDWQAKHGSKLADVPTGG